MLFLPLNINHSVFRIFLMPNLRPTWYNLPTVHHTHLHTFTQVYVPVNQSSLSFGRDSSPLATGSFGGERDFEREYDRDLDRDRDLDLDLDFWFTGDLLFDLSLASSLSRDTLLLRLRLRLLLLLLLLRLRDRLLDLLLLERDPLRLRLREYDRLKQEGRKKCFI